MYEPNPLFGGIRKMVGLERRSTATKVDIEERQQQQFLTAQPPADQASSEALLSSSVGVVMTCLSTCM